MNQSDDEKNEISVSAMDDRTLIDVWLHNSDPPPLPPQTHLKGFHLLLLLLLLLLIVIIISEVNQLLKEIFRKSRKRRSVHFDEMEW